MVWLSNQLWQWKSNLVLGWLQEPDLTNFELALSSVDLKRGIRGAFRLFPKKNNLIVLDGS